TPPPFTHITLLTFFFFNDPPPTQLSTLSLHDALPISRRSSPPAPAPRSRPCRPTAARGCACATGYGPRGHRWPRCRRGGRRHKRSEEHTSELQSLRHLVCRLLLEKKKKKKNKITH